MYLLYLIRKSIIVFTLLGLISHFQVFSQEEVPVQESFWKDVRFGGSLGANFSNDYFSAHLSPRAVYDFNQYVSAGTGIAGSYTNGSNFSAYSVSGSVLSLFRPIPRVQLSAEFEEIYVSRNVGLEGGNRKDSYWYPSLFLGAGYTSGNVTVGLRYDVLYSDEKSMYNNALMPFVSVYF